MAYGANTVDASKPTIWSKYLGKTIEKYLVSKVITSYKEEAGLKYGKEVDRPYINRPHSRNYTVGTPVTAQPITTTSDVMSINVKKTINIYVDNVEEIQTNISLAKESMTQMRDIMAEDVDAEVLYQVVNAGNSVDNKDVAAGSVGDPFALSDANARTALSKARTKLAKENIKRGSRKIALLSSDLMGEIIDYAATKGTPLGDKTSTNGYVGHLWGFDLYESNSLTCSKIWTPANNPTADDAITVNGITFTFKATPAAEGDIDLGGTTAGTLDNLVACINNNGLGGTSSTYFTFTDSEKISKLEHMVAVDGTTIATIYVKNNSNAAFSGTEAGDTWTKGICHCVAGVANAIDLVRQSDIIVKKGDQVVNGQWGANYMTNNLFGVKLFEKEKVKLVDLFAAIG